MDELFDWYVNNAYPSIKEFLTPLLPWMGLTFVAQILDFKLSCELNGIDRKKYPKPRFSRCLSTMANCILLVLLAGYCRITIGVELGVQVVSTVVLIAFACFEVTKCFNKFMLIENTGKRINLWNLFKGTHIHSVIEMDNEPRGKVESKTEEQ